jgi:purine-nucleoside phosphorylase
MDQFLTLKEMDEAANFIRSRITIQPRVAIILGSGLGGLAEMVADATVIPFAEIPHWVTSSVEGHKNRLVIGTLENTPVLVMQGRIHYYEGHRMDEVTFPIRVMQRLGIQTLVVTNAAGAIDPAYAPGDVMLITDHLSLIGMTGNNPLRGPNIAELGERFPDMSQAYDREYMEIARKVAQIEEINLHEGIYICLSGPSFETPADLRFMRLIGANAVGMSTVPEVIVAHHGGIRVLGFSGVSNKANLDGSTITTHEEVLQAGEIIVPKLVKLIRGFLKAV